MPVLTPPIEHRKALLTLAQMSDADYTMLRTALSEPETPNASDEAEILATTEENRPFVRVIQTIFVMHSVRAQYDLDVPDFVESVMTGVEDSGSPPFSSSEATLTTNRLRELMETDGALSRRSKARDVLKENSMVFCSCRVLTDIRPVFSKDAESDPEDMVIVHTIKLAFHESGKHKEVFVSADSKDLKKLRDALDRAEKKEATLTRMLTDKQVKVSDLSG